VTPYRSDPNIANFDVNISEVSWVPSRPSGGLGIVKLL